MNMFHNARSVSELLALVIVAARAKIETANKIIMDAEERLSELGY